MAVQVRLIVIVCYAILITVKTKLTICKKDDALASQLICKANHIFGVKENTK